MLTSASIYLPLQILLSTILLVIRVAMMIVTKIGTKIRYHHLIWAAILRKGWSLVNIVYPWPASLVSDQKDIWS